MHAQVPSLPLNVLVKELAMKENWEQVDYVLNALARLDRFMDYTFCMLFDGCGRRGNMQRALDLWDKWTAKVRLKKLCLHFCEELEAFPVLMPQYRRHE